MGIKRNAWVQWRKLAVLLLLEALTLGCGSTGRNEPGGPTPPCPGSGLVNDPNNPPNCTAPQRPTDGCPNVLLNLMQDTVTSGTLPPTPGATFEGEVMTVVDPHPDRSDVYTATIEAVLAPIGGGAVPPSCITEKQIRVYRSQAGGPPITDISAGLPVTAALGGAGGPTWLTDPWLAVGPDGTLFLSALFTVGSGSCATSLPNPTTNFQEEIQLWVRDPGATSFRQVATAPDPTSPGATMSQVSAGFNAMFGTGGLDHSRMAANPADPNEVVVTFLTVNGVDQIRTVRKDGSGTWNVVSAGVTALPLGTFSFANPAFDPAGNLYVAHALTTGPLVHRYDKDASNNWNLVASGGPTPTFPTNPITRLFSPGTSGIFVPVDPTPSLSIGRLGGNANPVVYMAYTVDTAGVAGTTAPITPRVEFSAADGNNLGVWLPSSPVGRGISWAQDIDFDGNANVLDLVYFSIDPATGTPTATSTLNTYHERHTASDPGVPFIAPQMISVSGLLLADIPIRSPGDTRTFPGEYNGVATLGEKAFFAWPDIGPAGAYAGGGALPTNNIDLGQANMDPVCPDPGALTASRPDNLWNCDCSCGGAISNMVGCAPDGVSDPAQACASVCIDTDCGTALSCATPRACAPTTAGSVALGNACNRAFGAPSGSPPSLFADFYATQSGGSSARFFFDGDSASTGLGGAVAFNVGSLSPQAGTSIEISRLQLSPSSFDVGGIFGARVRSIKLAHAQRFHGVFVDSTQFVIPAGQAEYVVDFTIDPDGPSWLTGDNVQRHLVVANASDIVGTLDLVNQTIRLDISFGNSDSGFEGTFNGALTAAPVDSDGDGVVDAIDNCPLVFNPDQVDNPPMFGEVTDQIIEICAPDDEILFAPPVATDECTPDEVSVEGVVVSINGVPQDPGIFLDGDAAELPSGTLIIEWTATDGNANETTVLQTVEVLTRPALYANQGIAVADNASARVSASVFATIDNAGSGEVNLGADSDVGDVLSIGRVFLRDRGHIHGLVKTGAQLDRQNQTIVDGSIEEGIAFFLPEFPVLDVDFPAASQNIDLQPDSELTLVPGSYGNVSIKSRSVLHLSAGTYYFTSFGLEPQAQVDLNKSAGPIDILVQQGFIYRGEFLHSDGSGADFFLGLTGNQAAFFEAEFQGIVVAPNTKITLGAGSALEFFGEFAAREIELRPGVTVWHDPFACEQITTDL